MGQPVEPYRQTPFMATEQAAYPEASKTTQPWTVWMNFTPVTKETEEVVCVIKSCAAWGSGSS